MKNLYFAFSALLCAGVLAGTAFADSTFNGSGTSGTLVNSSETWLIQTNGNLGNWGSPGVGQSVARYGESAPAYGLALTFSGGSPIDVASIAAGNTVACVGNTSGDTTFCTIPSALWKAFQTGPDSIDFLAQSASADLIQSQQYFVNVFFSGAAPTSFSGVWLTSFTPTPPASTPEPSSIVLLATSLLALAGLARSAKLRRSSQRA